MTLWVVRCGADSAYEQQALTDSVIGIGWGVLGDLALLSDRDSLRAQYEVCLPHENKNQVQTNVAQVHAFRNRIEIGDLVALPLRQTASIAFGRIKGEYKYVTGAPDVLRHQRKVEWINTSIPRTQIDQDLLYKFGAFLTVFRVEKNDAENRISALLSGKVLPHALVGPDSGDIDAEDTRNFDLPQYAKDQIRKHIEQKFAGHKFAQLISHILEAQGFTVSFSQPGADGGVDVLAGSGHEGFGDLKLAVQVKSGSHVSDAPEVRQLLGSFTNFGATSALFVSWSGFTVPAQKEARQKFFALRLWDSDSVISNLINVYDKLPDSVRAEIPLQKVWALTPQDTE